ncbi:MAG TPA: hypothetical protein VKZ18_00350 [Polyangia bacterium]|nr:hypothetical protein [Polyangia bacterium]
MKRAWMVVVLGGALLGCGKTPAASGQSGGHGGGAGAGGPAGGQGGAAATGQGGGGATGLAGGAGDAGVGPAGVNGPAGPGPIVSFGTDEGLVSVAWSGSVLLAIGPQGTVMQSLGTSGQWTENGLGFFSGGAAILWDGTRFMTVGGQSVNLTGAADAGSALRLDPTVKGSPVAISAVAWSGSSYVGVGEAGAIASSPDALTWTKQTSGTTDSLIAVVWTGSQFVALGSAGTILVSPDGAAWTVQRAALSGAAYSAMAWSGSRFVLVGSGFTETSTDGKTWTRTSGTQSMTCLAWSPALGLFAGAAGAFMVTSPDGATWTVRAAPIPSQMKSIIWAGNRFVGVGGIGPAGTGYDIILSSRDGAHWIVESMGLSLKSVTWTGNQFVIGGAGGTYLTSPDGLSWTIGYWALTNGAAFIDVAAWPGGYIFDAGALWSTPDLTTWTSHALGQTSCPGLTWTGSECLAVCGDGSFWSAADCQTWSKGTIAAANDQWINVVWTGSQLVAVGAGGLIATSPDGTSWTSRVSGTTQTLSGVTWSGQELCAVGNGVSTTSPDGVTWTAGTVIQSLALTNVAWTGTRFLAVGPNGTLLQATDGLTWSGTADTIPVNSLLSRNLNAIAFSGTRSIVVGDSGIILAVDR